MASLTLFCVLNLLAIVTQSCGVPGLSTHTLQEQSILADNRLLTHAQGRIIYVPVCGAHCYQHCNTNSHNHHQSNYASLLSHQQYHQPLNLQQDIHHSGGGISKQLLEQHHQVRNFEENVVAEGKTAEEEHHKKDENIHYKFEYSVNDHKTGDIKRQNEERKGDVVNGEYSLVEGDGNVRTVKYYADWKTGFHAQIHNSKPRVLG